MSAKSYWRRHKLALRIRYPLAKRTDQDLVLLRGVSASGSAGVNMWQATEKNRGTELKRGDPQAPEPQRSPLEQGSIVLSLERYLRDLGKKWTSTSRAPRRKLGGACADPKRGPIVTRVEKADAWGPTDAAPGGGPGLTWGKVWPRTEPQSQQGTCWKCRVLGSTPRVLSQNC